MATKEGPKDPKGPDVLEALRSLELNLFHHRNQGHFMFPKAYSEGFLFFLVGVWGPCLTRFWRVPASVRGVFDIAFLLGDGIEHVSNMSPRACGVVVSRGRRGESWQGARGACSSVGVSRGNRRGCVCRAQTRRSFRSRHAQPCSFPATERAGLRLSSKGYTNANKDTPILATPCWKRKAS